MFAEIFKGLFDTGTMSVITPSVFLLCIFSALVNGLILAGFYCYRTRYTKSFAAALALLPAIVCMVIMMVNGNVGAGVAVAGAFSLVRFRSVAGSAREICAVFLAMGTGLITGMGYLAYALLCTVILGFASAVYSRLDFMGKERNALYKTLHITIPEDLDYSDVFEPVFDEYTSACDLTLVKTTNMGSLFRLNYDLTLKNSGTEKEMIDKLRSRNGNLEISISNQASVGAEL